MNSIVMKMKTLVLILFMATFMWFGSVATAEVVNPTSHIDEKVITDYRPNGTVRSVDRKGSIGVFSNDILKDTTLTVTTTNGTNLESLEAYRPAVSSPAGDPTKMYLEIEDSDKALDYTIDPWKTPRLDVEIEYMNIRGGKEIHGGENVLEFSVVLESSEDMYGAEFFFKVPTETGPQGQDSFNLRDHGCTGDYDRCRRVKREGSNDHSETVEWSGNLYEREPVMISFRGVTEPGVNFNTAVPVDMDRGEYMATYENYDSTFTDISFHARYSRASARNGIDMVQKDGENWEIEGFLMNRADSLKYNVDGWELYRIDEDEPLINATVNEQIEPGEAIYTDTYYSDEEEKQYYFATFDWSVQWGDSIYREYVESEVVEMPLIRFFEGDLQKDLSIQQNSMDGRKIRVRDTLKNIGQEETRANRTEIFSIVPNESTDGDSEYWNIDDVSVAYRDFVNGQPRTRDITNDTNIVIEEPGSGSYGYVRAEVMANETTDFFEPNEDILLEYTIASGSSDEDRKYSFYSNSTSWSSSGTPDSQFAEENISLDGVDEPDPDPPDPSPPPAPKRLDLENIESTASVVTGNLVRITRSDMVRDTGNRGMRNIDLGVLLEPGNHLEEPSVEVQYKKDSQWNELMPDEYDIEKVGERTVNGEGFSFYEISIMSDRDQGLRLDDGEMINVTYDTRANFGRNSIVTRVSYYDYYDDVFVNDDKISPVRVGWEAEPMGIHRDRWFQDEAIVDEPVRWTREVTVNNPNKERMKRTLQIYLPDEAFSCYVDGEKLEVKEKLRRKFVNWEVDMGPLQRRIFEFESHTSPVVLDKEDIGIVESNHTSVEFIFNKEFRNYAPHEYEDVSHLVDIPYESISSVTIDGEDIDYIGSGEKTKIHLGSIGPGETVSVETVYRELPPILVLSPDSYSYTHKESSDITILVVGEEGHVGGHVELTVTGPEPSHRQVYSELIPMDNISKEILRTVDLAGLPEGQYNMKAVFRRNFQTITSRESSFYVEGRDELFAVEVWHIIAVFAAVVGLILSRLYRKKDRYQERIDEIRRKAKKKL